MSIAVIIAAYKASQTIARAISTALAETEVSEIILIDDASPDDTIERARQADDNTGRLKILRQPVNAGPAAARNRGIKESTAPWIAVLDADDFLLPGRMKGLLAQASEADIVADDLWQVPENAPDGPRKALIGDKLPLPKTISFAEFVLSNVSDIKRERAELGFIKPIMRRAFLEQHRLRYQENLRLGEDYELYARSLALGARAILIPVQGYVSVIRPNSLSGQHATDDLQRLRDCNQTLLQLPLAPADQKALRLNYTSVDKRLQWRRLIDAVRERDPVAALATFCSPLSVQLYLLERLKEQAVLRTAKHLNRQRS